MQTKIAILDDVLFSYSIVGLLIFFNVSQLDMYYMTIFGFIISAFLSYVEPFDLIIHVITVRTILHKGGRPAYLFEKAFETSYLHCIRLKFRTAFYLLIILLIITLLSKNLLLISLSITTLLPIIWKMMCKDYPNLLFQISAVAGYLATIEKPTVKAWEYKLRCVEKMRDALEAGNWFEALRFLNFVGVPGEVNIPQEVLDKAWKMEL